jgi:DivIVA domain-containing protein
MDRQAIERRDFPIVRRGYDPASVDAHLRALAAEVEELRRQLNGPARDSIASAAGAQVQGILEAAQASAQAIEAEAAEHARRAREEATADARRTREQAIATARERVAAVTDATEALLRRVGGMDAETRTLLESLRGGAGRLVADLEALAAEMGTLYDAAGRAAAPAEGATQPAQAEAVASPPAEPAQAEAGTAPQAGDGTTSQNGTAVAAPAPAKEAAPAAVPSQPAPAAMSSPEAERARPERAESAQTEPPAASTGEPEPAAAVAAPAVTLASAGEAAAQDVDGARLVALNMALNGDSREATGRYLAEHFEIAEPERLLDEVYAAIEG